MKGIKLKSVAAAIDATGNVEAGTLVGIRYVNSRGEIGEMQVSKRVAKRKKATTKGQHPTAKTQPNRKTSALIPVIDHSDYEQPKDLFLFGIIGFDPDGDLAMFYPVIRGDGD